MDHPLVSLYPVAIMLVVGLGPVGRLWYIVTTRVHNAAATTRCRVSLGWLSYSLRMCIRSLLVTSPSELPDHLRLGSLEFRIGRVVLSSIRREGINVLFWGKYEVQKENGLYSNDKEACSRGVAAFFKTTTTRCKQQAQYELHTRLIQRQP
jgi:hypothetical protein